MIFLFRKLFICCYKVMNNFTTELCNALIEALFKNEFIIKFLLNNNRIKNILCGTEDYLIKIQNIIKKKININKLTIQEIEDYINLNENRKYIFLIIELKKCKLELELKKKIIFDVLYYIIGPNKNLNIIKNLKLSNPDKYLDKPFDTLICKKIISNYSSNSDDIRNFLKSRYKIRYKNYYLSTFSLFYARIFSKVNQFEKLDNYQLLFKNILKYFNFNKSLFCNLFSFIYDIPKFTEYTLNSKKIKIFTSNFEMKSISDNNNFYFIPYFMYINNNIYLIYHPEKVTFVTDNYLFLNKNYNYFWDEKKENFITLNEYYELNNCRPDIMILGKR